MLRPTFVAICVCFTVSGCNIFQPPAGSVLEGTWTVTPEDPGDFEGVEYEAVFDSRGNLTEITATREDGATATLDTSDATTTLEGDQLTISIPRAGGASAFEGTLSEDQNTITGSLSQEVDLGDLEIVLPGGTITLERIEE